MKKISIVGIQGVPAKYGGFESLVENIINYNKPSQIGYTIFCSGKEYDSSLLEYKGAKLIYLPLKANGYQSSLYDMFSLLKTPKDADDVLVLGVSGCLFLPIYRLFSSKKVIINIDGLEHRREKWGRFAKWFLRTSEAMAVKYADVIISDNKAIQDYVKFTYNKDSVLIAYGGDHVLRDIKDDRMCEILSNYGLSKWGYSFTVCRIEPENNCHHILKVFSLSGKELVFVGNWNKNEYGRNLKIQYSSCNNIHMLDAIYDVDVLYVFRRNAKYYVHGHSAGGTNPSLVEAMFFARPILAFDVVYNRETTHGQAYYWRNEQELSELLMRENLSGESMKAIALEEYTWKKIAAQYEALY